MKSLRIRRSLALLLTLLLTLTILPVPALAGDAPYEEETPPEPLKAQEEEPVRGVTHAEVSPGVRNLVKRAYQLTDISWTPQKDLEGWKDRESNRFLAGQTYKGIPYGQPHRSGSYVPWETDLESFIRFTDDPDSPMYTDRAVSQTAQNPGPYYCCDCSAFISWAWGLPQHELTGTLSLYAEEIGTNLEDLQVGDCLNKAGTHARLVTDITYNSKGEMVGVEISEERQPSARRFWYRSSSTVRPLTDLQTEYLDKGYVILRCHTRDTVGYTHSCAVPLARDLCPICGVNPFQDLDLERWYAEPVAYVVNHGLMSGTAEDVFSPNDPLTRAMAVMMIWRMVHSPESAEMPPFSDVRTSDYYYPALCWAWAQGVVAGTGPNSFSPRRACTRAQLVTMLWQAAGKPKSELTECPFEDVGAEKWYYPAVLWALENGVVSGKSANRFAPNDNAARAEAAAMFRSACILLEVFTGK